jgi:tRNA A-37 threonylcarbamoyl transferase component Bud32
MFTSLDPIGEGVYRLRKDGAWYAFKPGAKPQEAMILAQLDHPNIVQGFGMTSVGLFPRRRGLLMELVDGLTLDATAAQGMLTRKHCDGILDAVEYLHDCGFAHCDLHGKNAVCGEGSKLVDMGMTQRIALKTQVQNDLWRFYRTLAGASGLLHRQRPDVPLLEYREELMFYAFTPRMLRQRIADHFP